MAIFDRLSNAWNIFTTSFAFIGRDKSLVIVPVLMLLSGIFFGVLGIILLSLLSSLDELFRWGIGILYLLFVHVWMTFLGAMQSWMVHEVAQYKDATIASGFKRAAENLLDIASYAVVFLAISLVASALRKRGRIGEIGAGFIDLFAGIIGKLALPAMIITERTFVEALSQLKESIHALPEIAAYEVGIRPITFVAIILGIGATIGLAQLSLMGAIIFTIIYVILLTLLTNFINNTYYTLLYLSLIEKKPVPGLSLR